MTSSLLFAVALVFGQGERTRTTIEFRREVKELQTRKPVKPMAKEQKDAVVKPSIGIAKAVYSSALVLGPERMKIQDQAELQLKEPRFFSAEPYGAMFVGVYEKTNALNCDITLRWLAEKGKRMLITFGIETQDTWIYDWEIRSSYISPGEKSTIKNVQTSRDYKWASVLVNPEKSGWYETVLTPKCKYLFYFQSAVLTPVSIK